MTPFARSAEKAPAHLPTGNPAPAAALSEQLPGPASPSGGFPPGSLSSFGSLSSAFWGALGASKSSFTRESRTHVKTLCLLQRLPRDAAPGRGAGALRGRSEPGVEAPGPAFPGAVRPLPAHGRVCHTRDRAPSAARAGGHAPCSAAPVGDAARRARASPPRVTNDAGVRTRELTHDGDTGL